MQSKVKIKNLIGDVSGRRLSRMTWQGSCHGLAKNWRHN